MAKELKAKDIKLTNLVDAINEGDVDVIKFVAKRQPMAVIFLTGLTTEQRNVFKGFPDFFSIRRLETAVCGVNEDAGEDEEATPAPAKKEKKKEVPMKKLAKKAAPVSDEDDEDDFDDFDEDEDEPAAKKPAKKAAKKAAPAKKSKKAKVEDDEDEDEDFDDFDDFDDFE